MAKKERMPANYKAILTHLFDRIHRTGEEIKNDFPNLLRTAIETEAWKHFKDNEGKPFENLVVWLQYTFPNGAGLGHGRNAITYKEALALTEGHAEVHRILAKHAPKGKAGRKKQNGDRTVAILDRHTGHMHKPVLVARLAQDFPDVYEAYLRGEYRSVRAAAEAAGLVKPGNDPMARLKSNWNKATASQRKEFLEWIKSEKAKK